MSWDGKSKGKTSGYKIFVFLLKISGINAAYFLLYFVAFHFFLFSNGKTKNSYRFYREKIKQGWLKACCSVYRNYYIFGQAIIDKVATMAGIRMGFSFDFEGESHLEQLAGEKRGAILLGAHLGNWDMAGNLLKRVNVPINVIIYDNEYENIKKYLDSVTGEKNYKVIAIKKDGSHIYDIIKALDNNEFVCLHADRHFEHAKMIKYPFLGEDAPFPEAIFQMCAVLGKPVTFVYAFKEKKRHYHLYATEPKVYTGNRTEKVQKILSGYVAELEQKTLEYPLHWFNFYNFWKE